MYEYDTKFIYTTHISWVIIIIIILLMKTTHTYSNIYVSKKYCDHYTYKNYITIRSRKLIQSLS